MFAHLYQYIIWLKNICVNVFMIILRKYIFLNCEIEYTLVKNKGVLD